ncbi:MAG: acetyl-CoA carboxylase biotin carboxyl carrier protein [Alphaproteobacteria bacterium]|nr:acetyl-CoA carboxylase biotin carboxyl carrier protein [Alphaproteobacteria bacterium]MBV9370374.1 acetyl-CoA carboxylase biotin carboxyl carrier protein [Alphaproteobacteria bacterium]MBV9901969.1 acetyl-CoA carboxylase biotin carboxyl carrier protein [Alphaproteobacteria bacterium]
MTDERDSPEAGGMRIEADLVRQLAELLNENSLTEIEVEDGERRIVVKRQVAVAAAAPAPAAPPPAAPAATPAAPAPAAAEASPASHPGAVKSPMVGTVYLSGEPGAKPFVSPGDAVKEGDTLLIVEAMKVMNPILASRAGTVRQVLVVDAQPVEFDQPLVIVE